MGPIHSFEDLIFFLRRRAGLIVLVTALGAVVALFVALHRQHLYRSEEVIQVQAPRVSQGAATPLDPGSSARRLQLIEQQIMSRQTLLEVARELGIETQDSALTDNEIAQRLRLSISIQGVAAARVGFADDGSVSLLRISATRSDPVEAQRLARAISQRTIALAQGNRLEMARGSVAFLRRQRDDASAQIDALNAKIAQFRRDNNLPSSAGLAAQRAELASITESILGIDRQIVAARQTLTEAEAKPTKSRVELRQIAEARGTLESLQLQRSFLQERAAALTEAVAGAPELERQLAVFQREMDSLQRRRDETEMRLKDAEVAFELEQKNQAERLTVLEPATVPDYAITGSRKAFAIAGALASLGLGLGLAFLWELWHPVVRSAAQMTRETGLRPIVSVPDLANKRPPRGKGRKRRWFSARR